MTMTSKKVLILGANGNFGSAISLALAKSNIPLVLCARRAKPLAAFADEIRNQSPDLEIISQCCDAPNDLQEILKKHQPILLINATGPFQTADYSIPKICIQQGVNYVDLADSREYVGHIKQLNLAAAQAGVFVISGASTVPALSSAVVEKYIDEFSAIYKMVYCIATGAKARRGLATTQAILSYLGRKIRPAAGGINKIRYGWQDIYRQRYPIIGSRWMANCEVPDLDLFHDIYAIKDIQFSAGMQSKILHFGIWACSWLVRMFPGVRFEKYSKQLLSFSRCFDVLGNADGGMHIKLEGIDHDGKHLEITWYIIALHGDGPHIPTIPAIYIAKKLLLENITFDKGAYACCGIIPLNDYMHELRQYQISRVEVKRGHSRFWPCGQ